MFAFVVLASPSLVGCRPPASSSVPVLAGQIVLVRQGSTVGAFFTTNGTSSPDLTDYTWFLRSDGKTTFSPKDAAVITGSVTRTPSIAFGPFRMDWSSGGGMSGYIYYPSSFWWFTKGKGIPMPSTLKMAFTSETNITAIDASDRKWHFRGGP